MKDLDEIISTPRPIKKTGYTHNDAKYILKIPCEARSPQAIEVLLKQHRKLAYQVAMNFWKKYKGKISSVVDFDDLLSAANEGLLIAIKRYNQIYNTEFSTFALHWIRQKTQRELDNNFSQVRIPIHFLQSTKRMMNGYDDQFLKDKKLSRLTIHRFCSTNSIDVMLPDDDITYKDIVTYKSLEYMYPYSNFEDPENTVLKQDLRERIDLMINAIPKSRYQKIIRRRFGLDDYGGDRTLEDVGKEFNLTRERIRQICEKAFKRVQINKYIDETDLKG